MLTKSGLAIFLSRLKTFEKPKLQPEQYQTDSEAAAEILWFAAMKGDIKDKTIADLGAGNGILGIGALALGAGKVWMVENDGDVMPIINDNTMLAKDELEIKGKADIVNSDINDFDKKVNTVFQNPPFGTKVRHADREFLEKAFEIADVVYSFHKKSTTKFVEAISRDRGFRITNAFDINFRIKKLHSFHKKPVRAVEVSCFRLERSG